MVDWDCFGLLEKSGETIPILSKESASCWRRRVLSIVRSPEGCRAKPITFYGGSVDPNTGLPANYHVYDVWERSAPWSGPNAVIATIHQLTAGSHARATGSVVHNALAGTATQQARAALQAFCHSMVLNACRRNKRDRSNCEYRRAAPRSSTGTRGHLNPKSIVCASNGSGPAYSELPMKNLQTLHWVGGVDGCLRMIDQTRLPVEFVEIECCDVQAVWEAIKMLRVRGAGHRHRRRVRPLSGRAKCCRKR